MPIHRHVPSLNPAIRRGAIASGIVVARSVMA
jgi:hypothetical protein